MIAINNLQVYDLAETLYASGNAMRTEYVNFNALSDVTKNLEVSKGVKRLSKLAKLSKNTDVHCHDNALTGIRVSFDIIYPQYWTPEAQRYHFFDIVTSSSKMHRLLMMDVQRSCNKYVNLVSIRNLQQLIDNYNVIMNDPTDHADFYYNSTFVGHNGETYEINNKQDALYVAWMQVLSNCPLGLELFMRVSTNYKQLQTMYFQRRNHKLKEDWGEVCKMIESLPYFKELILGEYDEPSV